ncbi:ABC transporter substrate-binding protein [Streptomyces sp. NPDC049585]|uniref:ABC transporter substrate-binding protein n=1 Tax=Streptomyces sp. NPDC049585 TaxID=3155154 RepID=UPI00343ABEDB
MGRIPPLTGVKDLVAVLDGLVGRPVGRRELPAVVLEGNHGQDAAFVTGYRDRLRDASGAPVAPHALLGEALVERARRSAEPDVVLLDELTRQLEQTMPAAAGGLTLSTYWTCRRVLDIDAGAGAARAQRRTLAEELCVAWEKDTPGLKGLRSFISTGGAGQISERLGAIATVLVAWPLEWVYRTWLNRTRRLRWYAPKVRSAGGPAATRFLAAAVSLSKNGELRNRAALRQSLLLEALAVDLVRAARRGVLLPRRRRRVWPFVVLLPRVDEPRSATRRLLDGLVKLHRRGLPLLVLAADRTPVDQLPDVHDEQEGRDAPSGRRRVQTPAGAADCLRPLLEGRARSAGAGVVDGRLRVRLSGEDQTEVSDWLDINVAVSPRSVPWPSAYLGVLLALALLAGAVPVVNWVRQDACHDTWAAQGVRVGVDTASEGCYFTDGGSQELLRTLQDRIRAQNAVADRGAHRTVVFLSPLTADPQGKDEQITPAGVLQLEGAADAQREFNKQAAGDAERPYLRLLIANAGYAFAQGREVADRLNTLTGDGTSISAVIGISQSRQASVDAINRLSPDLPVIGAAVTGDFMTTDTATFVQTQPTNRHLARALTRRVMELKRKKALVIYDDKDRYSLNLRQDLDTELAGQGIGLVEPEVVRTPDFGQPGVVSTLPELAKKICALNRDNGITLFAARGSQLPKILNEVQAECGSATGTPFPFLASDVDTLIEYPELPEFAHLGRYTAVDLSYIAFSPDHHSDHAAGSDAFRAAAAAVYRTWTGTKLPPRASNVLQQLRNSVDVKDTVAQDRPFHLPSDDRALAERPLYLCTVAHASATTPACLPADGKPLR